MIYKHHIYTPNMPYVQPYLHLYTTYVTRPSIKVTRFDTFHSGNGYRDRGGRVVGVSECTADLRYEQKRREREEEHLPCVLCAVCCVLFALKYV